MRTVKKVLVAGVSVALKEDHELQCRYRTRRIVVVSKRDPKYDRSTAGAPKAVIIGGLVKETGMAFIEAGALNQCCNALVTPQSVSEMEQEINALLR